MPRRDQRRRDGSFEYVQLDLPREGYEGGRPAAMADPVLEQTDPPPADRHPRTPDR